MSISNQAGSLTIFPLTGTLSNPMKGISLASTSPASFVFTDTAIPFDQRITFTRSTAGNIYDSTGDLESIAENVARANANQDYNPSTLAARGFLIEAGATNLLLGSAVLATQGVTVSAVQYTLSFFGTGTVTLSGASTAGPLIGTGANNLVTLTFTPSAGTLTLTVTGSVLNAQLETGAIATSRIITVGSAVARGADNAVISDLASIGYNQSQGFVYAEFMLEGLGSTTLFPTVLTFSDGTIQNRISLFVNDVANDLCTFVVRTADVNQCNITAGAAVAVGTLVKIAASWANNSFRFAVNGAAGVEDTGGTVPTVDRLSIGRSADSVYHLNGWLPKLTYGSQLLTTAQLQALTA